MKMPKRARSYFVFPTHSRTSLRRCPFRIIRQMMICFSIWYSSLGQSHWFESGSVSRANPRNFRPIKVFMEVGIWWIFISGSQVTSYKMMLYYSFNTHTLKRHQFCFLLPTNCFCFGLIEISSMSNW